jgi:hypothetical protein
MNRRSFLNGIVGAGFVWAAQRSKIAEASEAPGFGVRFEDVAAQAGLVIPTIFGGRTENNILR